MSFRNLVGPFGGRSRHREHVSLFDVHSGFGVVYRVTNVACQSLHSIGGVFEQQPLEDALDLCDERICVLVGVDADLVLVEADLRHLRQDPGSFPCVDAEERAAVHGEI